MLMPPGPPHHPGWAPHYATVDHFAIGLDRFDRDSVREELKAHGLTPHEDIDTGLHVKDPDGFNVQLTSGT